MNNHLLIVGAGIYGVVAYEIADSMKCFDKIAFVDDTRISTPNGFDVVGTTKDLDELACQYSNIVVAIGNPDVRMKLLGRIEEELPYRIVSLVSPRAYVAPSAQIMAGCIIEPMVVIHTGCVIAKGCLVSAGAVVNHASMLCDGVHVDCNATVVGNTIVPVGTKVESGTVYRKQNPHPPLPLDGKTYNFDDVM